MNLDMTKTGKVKWSRFTGNNIGNQVAIVLDKKVFMAPTIQNKISSGGTRITGFANKQEAQDIAAVLKAGELPAPIKIAQINYIGPSLGQDSIDSGWKSMIFGILIATMHKKYINSNRCTHLKAQKIKLSIDLLKGLSLQ